MGQPFSIRARARARAACCPGLRTRRPPAGINRATGRPFRVMMHSAPASTSRIHRASAWFALWRLIVLLMRGFQRALQAEALSEIRLAWRVALEYFLDTFGIDTDLDPGALLLDDHRRARVAVPPAAVQRLGELGERQIRDPHRHVEVAAELGGETPVLVGEPQRKGGGLVLAGQELIDQPVEGASPTARTVAHGLP